jgi:DeoR/GlpR family transcriptional regulator of sugar metabolism
VARALKNRHLTIITNSLPVINAFAGMQSINLIGLGGMLRTTELSFIGHITEQALAEFHANKVIIGTRAISTEKGLTHDYLPETMTDRAIIDIGRELIVVADHTKFGRLAAASLAPIERIHTIVTDRQVPQDFVDDVRARGVRVILS